MTCRATELADALSRQRTRGQQRIVVQHIHGGQAVGMVDQGESTGVAGGEARKRKITAPSC